MQEAFESFGTIIECHIPIDDTKRNKGYAFVRFSSDSVSSAAMESMDGTDFQGRLIHVMQARKSRDEDGGESNENNGAGSDGIKNADGEAGGITYKKSQEMARRKEDPHLKNGWSSSFVRGDAVVDNIADRLGLRKGDFLNVQDGLSSGNAAVRMALGETQIIEENRDYFRSHGIDMDTLISVPRDMKKGHKNASQSNNASLKRSSTMILVKNLPYDTTEDELCKLFHGIAGDTPKQILLPPSKTIALVEYGHPTDARRAFRKLAYKRFKHVPLYLEWAPLCSTKKEIGNKSQSFPSMSDDISKNNKIDGISESSKETTVNLDGNNDVEFNESAMESGVSVNTLYVKNLNFLTTETKLKKMFEDEIGKVRAVKIPTKTKPLRRINNVLSPNKDNTEQVSMGYGFVEFDSEDAARRAIKKFNKKQLDGHSLQLELSSTKVVKDKSSLSKTSKKENTKMVIRNVPFQASRTDLLQLFGSFGQLKKVLLFFSFLFFLSHFKCNT